VAIQPGQGNKAKTRVPRAFIASGLSTSAAHVAPLGSRRSPRPRKKTPVIVLLSGGLDSSVSLAWALSKGYQAHTLCVRYGQKHVKEIRAASRISRSLKAASHRLLAVDLGGLGGSSLTARGQKIPRNRSARAIERSVEKGGIPSTYVPARNSIFLSLAAAAAEVEGASEVVIGTNALDYSGYVDCRPKFLTAMGRALRWGTVRGVRTGKFKILAPLLRKTKAEIIRLGLRFRVDFSLTWSCYLGRSKPCGSCDSCILRAKGFQEAHIQDPLLLKGRS